MFMEISTTWLVQAGKCMVQGSKLDNPATGLVNQTSSNELHGTQDSLAFYNLLYLFMYWY